MHSLNILRYTMWPEANAIMRYLFVTFVSCIKYVLFYTVTTKTTLASGLLSLLNIIIEVFNIIKFLHVLIIHN